MRQRIKQSKQNKQTKQTSRAKHIQQIEQTKQSKQFEQSKQAQPPEYPAVSQANSPISTSVWVAHIIIPPCPSEEHFFFTRRVAEVVSRLNKLKTLTCAIMMHVTNVVCVTDHVTFIYRPLRQNGESKGRILCCQRCLFKHKR